MKDDPSTFEGGPGTGLPGELLPRLGSRIIDSIIVAVVGVTVGFALDFNFLWLLIQASLVFAYFVLFDAYRGTTPGKQIFGLKVIGPEGGKPAVKQASIREAFTLVGGIPYVGPLLALIVWIVIAATIASSPTNQGKHDDLAGGTRVVRA